MRRSLLRLAALALGVLAIWGLATVTTAEATQPDPGCVTEAMQLGDLAGDVPGTRAEMSVRGDLAQAALAVIEEAGMRDLDGAPFPAASERKSVSTVS